MRKLVLFLLISVLFIVGGCSTNEIREDHKQSSIVVEHAFGKTILEQKPERIVSIGWENQDVALALGMAPVAMSMPAYGTSKDSAMRLWTKEKYEALEANEPIIFNDLNELDFEAIEKAKPDVIIAAYSGISQEDYDLLSMIAPVIAYQDKPFMITWQTQVKQNAKGLGLDAEGEQLIADLEVMIEEQLTKYPVIKDKTATFVWFDASDLSSIYVYGNADPRSKYLQDLGLTLPDKVKKVTDEAGGFFATISAEQAELLNDSDILVIYDGNTKLLEKIQSDPILGKVRAIRKGSVVLLEENQPVTIAAATPTALSIPYAVKEYVAIIANAASKVQ